MNSCFNVAPAKPKAKISQSTKAHPQTFQRGRDFLIINRDHCKPDKSNCTLAFKQQPDAESVSLRCKSHLTA